MASSHKMLGQTLVQTQKSPKKIRKEPLSGSVVVVVRLILQKEKGALRHASIGRMANASGIATIMLEGKQSAVRSSAQTMSMVTEFPAEKRIHMPTENDETRLDKEPGTAAAHVTLVWWMIVVSAGIVST